MIFNARKCGEQESEGGGGWGNFRCLCLIWGRMNGSSVTAPLLLGLSRFSFTKETFAAFLVYMRKFLRVFYFSVNSPSQTVKHRCSRMQYNEAHLHQGFRFFRGFRGLFNSQKKKICSVIFQINLFVPLLFSHLKCVTNTNRINKHMSIYKTWTH